VLSDTHGLLRDEALSVLEDADVLFHAGDVGSDSILDRLEGIAPLHAVRGNTDFGSVAERLPLDVVTDVRVRGGTLRVYMKHIREEIDLDPAAAEIDVVITGHTHRPLVERIDGVLWLNPGSCGPRRFDLPVTVAVLGADPDGRPTAEIVDLAV
jgi:putative phosphoesterase